MLLPTSLRIMRFTLPSMQLTFRPNAIDQTAAAVYGPIPGKANQSS